MQGQWIQICLKYIEFGIKWKKIKFWTLEDGSDVYFAMPFYHLVKKLYLIDDIWWW